MPGAEAVPTRRVLLLCDWFLKYVAPFAVALKGTGAEVALLCSDHATEFGGAADERQALIDRLVAAGVEVIVMPGANTSVSRAAWTALREARAFKADVIHAQTEILDPRMLLAARGAPVVLMVHDPEPHLGAATHTFHHGTLQALWRRRADLILVHGERLAKAVRTSRPVRVIPHGMVPHERPLPRPREPVVLLFGRLEYYKGVRVMLEAMELVWAKRPDVRLVVAGEGPEVGHVPTDDPRIEFHRGYVPEAEVETLYARASLVALPYLEGSQSGVGLLALARGVPLVVTDVGDLPDLVPDETFVARPGDPQSLAGTLLAHLDHDDAFRAEALESSRAKFGWDAVARRALQLYDELLARPAGIRRALARLRRP